jgi:hypothetical protein
MSNFHLHQLTGRYTSMMNATNFSTSGESLSACLETYSRRIRVARVIQRALCTLPIFLFDRLSEILPKNMRNTFYRVLIDESYISMSVKNIEYFTYQSTPLGPFQQEAADHSSAPSRWNSSVRLTTCCYRSRGWEIFLLRKFWCRLSVTFRNPRYTSQALKI